MNKTFNIAIDVNKPVEPSNSFRIYRGDNVTFNFTFNNGEEAFDTSSATTLRVFAKLVKANGVDKTETPLFAGDFTTITTATFASANTAGDAGNYLLAVMLLDAQDNVITAQGIYFDLIENGYAGIYQPSEDFRDEVLDALSEAQAAQAASEAARDQAQQYATNASNSANEAAQEKAQCSLMANAASESATQAQTYAQEAESEADRAFEYSNTTAQAAGVFDLQLTKQDSGALHFGSDGGALIFATNPCASAITRSYFFTLQLDSDWDITDTVTAVGVNIIGDIYYANSLYQGVSMRLGTDSEVQIISGKTASGNTNLAGYMNVGTLFCGEEGNVIKAGNYAVVVVANYGDSSSSGKIFINGALRQSGTTEAVSASTFNASTKFTIGTSGNFGLANFTNAKLAGAMSRIGAVNFDMSAADAPYTVDNYTSGKLPSPAIKNTASGNKLLLWLANYTIARNATTRLVKDGSGNACDATVEGDVAGDYDESISAFVDELKTQINQSNG